MQRFLKIVGNGRKTARDLTPEEAEEAFELIMRGQASPAQVAVFMAALRIKEESIEELGVFTRILRQYCQRIPHTQAGVVDVCVPYDGRSKTHLLIPASALIAAAAGANIALHGRVGQVLPPKFGVGIGDVLKKLNVAVECSLQDANDILAQVGVSFILSENFAPCLNAFDPVRLEYGMRSFFNTIEKLVNPFNAEAVLVGVFHGLVMPRVAGAARSQGYARGMVVQGPEGSIEALTSRRNPILEFSQADEALTEWTIDPAAFNCWGRIEDPRPITAETDAELTLELLQPTGASPYRQSAQLTAALMLYASGKTPSYEAGLEVARNSLESGAALERLRRWQEISQKRRKVS